MRTLIALTVFVLGLSVLAPLSIVAASGEAQAGKTRPWDYINYGYCPGTARRVKDVRNCGRKRGEQNIPGQERPVSGRVAPQY
jgi:hypothetical protein